MDSGQGGGRAPCGPPGEVPDIVDDIALQTWAATLGEAVAALRLDLEEV